MAYYNCSRRFPAGNGQGVGRQSYLSPAPQAEPQAAGFSSGLSEAPQAEPQAADAVSFLLQPNRFEIAIVFYLQFWIAGYLPRNSIVNNFLIEKSTHKSIT